MQVPLDAKTIEKYRERGKKSLFFFTRAILGFDKLTKDIHLPLCKKLEDLEHSTTKRLGIVLPRDWYKTTVASISYPIWRAINNPEIRVLLTQNTYTNACSKLQAIKQIFEKNELFRVLYSDILPGKSSKWSGDSLCVTRKGTYPESTFEAAGTNTAVVSRHYDLIIEDDTVAPSFDNMTGAMMQPTRAEVEKCIGWHKLAGPLLIEPGLSQILVIGTRWIEDDLLEWIMKNEPHYEWVKRSVREDEAGNPSKTGRIVWSTTDDGRPKFNDQVLASLEASLGPYMFATLYLNMPVAAENMLFKPSWITYYETAPTDVVVITSVDLASEQDSSSDPDYSTVVTTALDCKQGQIYVLHYDRGRLDPLETIETIFDHYRKYKFHKLFVEAIGYQRTLCFWLEQKQKSDSVFFPIEEIKSYSASKNDRIRGLQPFYANGRVVMRPWMVELENELIHFPYGRHDDLIDALSAQVPFWNERIEHERKRYSIDLHQQTPDLIVQRIIESQQKEATLAIDFGPFDSSVHDSPFRRKLRSILN